MESELIKVNIDEQTELAFDIKIQGESNVVPKFRLVCETPDVALAFPGRESSDGTSDDGTFTVNVLIPKMVGRLNEGSYDAQLEVILGDRVFIPLKMRVGFSIPLKVEAAKVKGRVIETTQVSARVVNKVPKETKVESRPKTTQGSQAAQKRYTTLREQYKTLPRRK